MQIDLNQSQRFRADAVARSEGLSPMRRAAQRPGWVKPRQRGPLQMPQRARSMEGFTLIELMMVLVLLGILLSVGGTSFQSSLQRNRLQSTLQEMAGALSFARGEAVVRTQPVALCPTTDNVACGGTAWETGYLVFVDDGFGGGSPGDGTLNGGEELLRVGEPGPRGVTVRSLGYLALSNIVFLADGRIQQGLRGALTICDDRGAASARGLITEVSGQTRLAADTDGNGSLEDHTGTALVCP